MFLSALSCTGSMFINSLPVLGGCLPPGWGWKPSLPLSQGWVPSGEMDYSHFPSASPLFSSVMFLSFWFFMWDSDKAPTLEVLSTSVASPCSHRSSSYLPSAIVCGVLCCPTTTRILCSLSPTHPQHFKTDPLPEFSFSLPGPRASLHSGEMIRLAIVFFFFINLFHSGT